DIRSLYVSTPAGEQIPLGQIAQVNMEQAPNQIQRDQTRRRITLGFNVRGRDVESIVAELQQKVSQQIKFPAGYSVTYGGTFQNLVDAKQRLSVAVPIALGLIFALLFFTFNSVRQSLMIFMAIPLAAIGGVFALLLRGMPFSISAGVGFIALFGVAVLNGIVLIAEFNRLRQDEGLTDMAEIIRQGTEIRLRPVIMTALVASFGFIPMALSNSAGAEVQKPLATVVIGGLLTATLLTLIIMPILYSLFERKSLERDIRDAEKQPGKSNVPVVNAVVGTIGLLILLSPSLSWGQVASFQTLTLDQALQQAGSRNAQIQIANLGLTQQQALRRTAYDAGRLSATAILGQYNSRRFDNNLTVSHTIPNPVLMRRLAGLNDQTVATREAAIAVTQNDIRYQVKSAYYELNYLHQRRRLYRQQDTLLTEFVQAATLRVKTGEAGSLEKATAESQLADQRVRLAQLEAELTASRTRLKTLLYSPDPLDATDQILPRLTLPYSTDSLQQRTQPGLALPGLAQSDQHPQVRLLQQQIRQA
ncbi:MAG TPA: efflux RND transporter permease subunit, partial [Fibrella sp.]